MSEVVEVNDDGSLVLPRKAIGSAQPHTRYLVEAHGASITLRQVAGQEFWATATPDEWVTSFLNWVNGPHPSAPILPDEAMRRDSIYD